MGFAMPGTFLDPAMFAHCALLSPPWTTLSYIAPDCFPRTFWQPGLRVAVPLGKGGQTALRAAVVLEFTDTPPQLPPGVVCRELGWPLEVEPLLTPELTNLAQDLARRQGVEPGYVLGHVLPQGLRQARLRLRHVQRHGATDISLRQAALAEPDERLRLARAVCDGSICLLPPGTDAASEELCLLQADPPWPVRPSASRQIGILEFLHEQGSVSRKHLLKSLGAASAPALQSLLRAGHVALVRPEMESGPEQELLPPPPLPFQLSEQQNAVLTALTAQLDAGRAVSCLLHGVTGSGKTAVYLELARTCLARGKSLLLLAPEVALAHKLRRDASCALPDVPLYLYHGYQTSSQREATCRALAARREPCLVVGTRSALFLPIPDLGCIVLDEEHDASFKQDDGFSYQAKEVAWSRMAHSQGLLLLASATPDIKTFHAASSGRLPLLRLPERIGGKALPPVELVDISKLSAAVSDGNILAFTCEAALREVIARGEQAVVLLNRRGYAPLMYCLACGSTQRCPQCEIGLTYHKGREKLVCHYCGHSRPFPAPCDKCKGMDFLPLGEGTERLAEQLSVLAGQPVLRLDRDSTRRPGRMEEILAAFARQEAPILVGTQMLSKGHHFPQVTLAVVADGDLGLNLPDYRAAERTFQLLLQSAGRAGRGEKAGRVLIQTRDVSHYCWQYVQSGDYEGFYAAELARRQKWRYPPFVRLALMRFSFAQEDAGGMAALNELAAAMRVHARELGVQMLGPAPAPLALLRGRRRYHCLLKAADWPHLRQLYFCAKVHAAARPLRLSLDLDPVSML